MGRSQRHKVYYQGVASNDEIVAEGEINPLVKQYIIENYEPEQPGPEPETPVITTMSPLSGPVGSADVPITVTGTSFVQDSVILWDGTELATTFIDETSLNATAPVSLSTAEGQAEVRVASGEKQSNAVYFTFTAAVP